MKDGIATNTYRDIDLSKYVTSGDGSLISDYNYQVGPKIKSNFVYTQDYILNTLLPKLKTMRNSYIYKGTREEAQAKATYHASSTPTTNPMAQARSSTPPTAVSEPPSWDVTFTLPQGESGKPAWQQVDFYQFENTMTIVLHLDDYMPPYLSEGDQIAAIVNNEVREIADIQFYQQTENDPKKTCSCSWCHLPTPKPRPTFLTTMRRPISTTCCLRYR
jgi:hypothetical protein